MSLKQKKARMRDCNIGHCFSFGFKYLSIYATSSQEEMKNKDYQPVSKHITRHIFLEQSAG